MYKILITITILCFFSIHYIEAQQVEGEDLQIQHTKKVEELGQLQQSLEDLTAQVAALQGEVAILADQITPYPRWNKGLFGNVGFNLSNYSDWLAKNTPSVSAANIGLNLNAFIHLDQKKFFWRNTGNINLGWLKFNNKEIETDNTGFEVAADAFQLSSLLGYKFSEKLALSSIIDYRTSLLEGKLNNPGYLNFGSLGLMWTPNPNLSVAVHSLSYNLVLSDSDEADNPFQSSFGTKIFIDYTQQLPQGIAWTSNLNAFLSYEDFSGLSDWAWTNNFTTAVKGIGVGMTIGLRTSKQEALALGRSGNPLQSFWLLGLTYNL